MSWLSRFVLGFFITISVVSVVSSETPLRTLINIISVWAFVLFSIFLWKKGKAYYNKTSETIANTAPLAPVTQIKEERVQGSHTLLSAKQLTLDEENYLIGLEEEILRKHFDPPISLSLKRKKKHGYRKTKKTSQGSKKLPPEPDKPYDLV